jgi:hypothetical protein
MQRSVDNYPRLEQLIGNTPIIRIDTDKLTSDTVYGTLLAKLADSNKKCSTEGGAVSRWL